MDDADRHLDVESGVRPAGGDEEHVAALLDELAKVHTDANGNAPKLSDIPDNAKLTKDEVRGLANEKL